MQPVRVLVVSSSNTARSVMAEAVLRARIAASSIAARAQVSSAGLLVEPDAPAEPHAVTALRRVGLDASAHRATQFDFDDIADQDLVLFVEQRHIELFASAGPPRGSTARIRLLRSFDPVATALRMLDLTDPRGQHQPAYDRCLKDIRAAAPRVVHELRQHAATDRTP